MENKQLEQMVNNDQAKLAKLENSSALYYGLEFSAAFNFLASALEGAVLINVFADKIRQMPCAGVVGLSLFYVPAVLSAAVAYFAEKKADKLDYQCRELRYQMVEKNNER